MNEDLDIVQAQIDKKKMEIQTTSIFDKKKAVSVVEEKPKKESDELVNNMFNEAVKYEVANNEELQDEVLDTAKQFTKTKMQIIKTDVDTEHKEAVFNNRKDACESYGFSEKTTPTWATKAMTWGYNVMLAIWLFVGTFTFMPVIFIAKKMAVGLKKTWLAVIFAIILYLGITFVPLLLALLR